MEESSFSWKKYAYFGLLFSGLLVLATAVSIVRYPNPVTQAVGAVSLFGSYDTVGRADAKDIFIEGDKMYLVTDNNSSVGPELYIFNIDAPRQPSLVSSLHTGYPVNKVMVQNHYAYLATAKNTKEVVVLNVKNATSTINPNEVGAFDIPGDRSALSIYALGKWLYVGTKNNTNSAQVNGAEFLVFSIENPTQPTLLATYEIGGDVNDIDVTGKYAYLATSNPNKEFMVLDVDLATSSLIREKSSYNVSGSTVGTGVWYSRNRLYGVTENNGSNPDFFVWNTPSPNSNSSPSLVLLGSLNMNKNNTGVEVYGDYALVSSRGSSGGVSAIATASSSAPVMMGFFPTGDSAQAVAAKDSVVFIASANNTQELQVAHLGINAEPPISDRNGDGKIMVSCLGDSNTSALGTPQSWCTLFLERIPTSSQMTGSSSASTSIPMWTISNLAVPGTTSLPNPATSSKNAPYQIASATLNYAPDVVVSQFGTNDISLYIVVASSYQVPLNYYTNIEQTINALRALDASTTLANAVPVRALVPPRNVTGTTSFAVDGDILVLMLNNRIRHEFSSPHVIDFFSSVVKPDDFADQVHFLIGAHRKWADQVYQDLYLNGYSGIQ